MTMNDLFTTTTEETASSSSRNLAGTAQLTSLSNSITSEVITLMDGNFDLYKEQFTASKTDNNVMDALIQELVNITLVDIDFLKALDEETLNSMLKSQQSKRSRTKSKSMTLDNYKTLMSGAVAELLLRRALDKAKSSAGYRRATGSLEYTAEDIETLTNDQEALKREIRNVQSKKSIMKSKADFTEDDERWTQLLAAETTLKDLRVSGGTTTTTKVVVVDKTGEQLKAELGDRDIDSLKAADAKALLKKLLEQTASEQVPVAAATDEDIA